MWVLSPLPPASEGDEDVHFGIRVPLACGGRGVIFPAPKRPTRHFDSAARVFSKQSPFLLSAPFILQPLVLRFRQVFALRGLPCHVFSRVAKGRGQSSRGLGGRQWRVMGGFS